MTIIGTKRVNKLNEHVIASIMAKGLVEKQTVQNYFHRQLRMDKEPPFSCPKG